MEQKSGALNGINRTGQDRISPKATGRDKKGYPAEFCLETYPVSKVSRSTVDSIINPVFIQNPIFAVCSTKSCFHSLQRDEKRKDLFF